MKWTNSKQNTTNQTDNKTQKIKIKNSLITLTEIEFIIEKHFYQANCRPRWLHWYSLSNSRKK